MDVESGCVPRSRFGHASYQYAKANIRDMVRGGTMLLQLSRSTDSPRRGDSEASIAVLFGEDDEMERDGGQLTETELRELLVAIGCDWAKP